MARLVAASDFDGSFGNFEVFRESLHESVICLAVMRPGTQVNCQLARSGFDNFFLAGARFDGDLIFHVPIFKDELLVVALGEAEVGKDFLSQRIIKCYQCDCGILIEYYISVCRNRWFFVFFVFIVVRIVFSGVAFSW